MNSISTIFTRGNFLESVHNVKCYIINNKKEILLSTISNKKTIYPRSAIKIFQAIPFVSSGAVRKYNLNKKQIALACSSHSGEKFHIDELKKWLNKLSIPLNKIQCGIHNPLDKDSAEKLLIMGKIPNELHNNCSGKHLAMLSSSFTNKFKTNNYLHFDHPHQINIRKTLESFSQKKIKKENFGTDGCSAPQYAFTVKDLSTALLNLVKSYNSKFYFNYEVGILMDSILNNPKFIGGSKKYDSQLIKISNRKIFCKGGAEGVFLFTHLKKQIVGIIKIEDGNERALPSAVSAILEKLKITSKDENKQLAKWKNSQIKNHAKKITGEVFTNIK